MFLSGWEELHCWFYLKVGKTVAALLTSVPGLCANSLDTCISLDGNPCPSPLTLRGHLTQQPQSAT